MKYFQEWSSAASTPWFTKDESRSTILYALKLCEFLTESTASGQKRITDVIVKTGQAKLKELVYDILPSTTAVFSYTDSIQLTSSFLLVLK